MRKNFKILTLTFLLTSCGVGHKACHEVIGDRGCSNFLTTPDHTDKLKDLRNKNREQDERLSEAETIIKLNTKRIELISGLQESFDIALQNVTNAVDGIIIPEIEMLNERLEDLDYNIANLDSNQQDFSAQVVMIETLLAETEQEIIDINNTLTFNDTYKEIPGCEHSYFVLYDSYGNIKDLFLTEGNGTVHGAWTLRNNRKYNLLIDDVVLCTNVQLKKNQKTLKYDDGTGLQTIDLSY